MIAKKTKDGSGMAECCESGCNPKDLQEMLQQKGTCCPPQGDLPDCASMMKIMMKGMPGGPEAQTEGVTQRETCCGPAEEAGP